MSAPLDPKNSTSNANVSKITGGLRPATRVRVLAVCLALMIGASVYAVLQPLNPDTVNTSFSARFWYPHETNPYARLQAVGCANDYACRLNSVAIKTGSGDLPEVWAVGNVGLVLPRKAGQRRWEQLTISATQEGIAKPVSAPKPTPTPVRSVVPTTVPTPRPTPVPNITPISTSTPLPTSNVAVPSLIGLGPGEAQKVASADHLQLKVEYEDGFNQAQRSRPSDLTVIEQSPEAGCTKPSD